jgi:NAD(P)-dependent dehydrogenase (short-subunit alcohol dehydrogenase family)
MDSLAGKVAVVTGGASGIGRALVRALAQEGARVAVADVDDAGLAATVEMVSAAGGTALAVKTDVSRLADLHALADRVYAAWGVAHVLCNNAGVTVHGGLEAATHRDWEWVIGVNLWGVIHGIEAFVPRMIAGGEPGHVVNTASMAGLIASQGLGVYNTTKYAVVGLSETLQKDLRPYRIGVSVLCPMGVSTAIRESDRNRPAALRNPRTGEAAPITLIGRTLSPEHVAARVIRAIKADQLYVITHEEGLEPLRRRFQRLERAIQESK